MNFRSRSGGGAFAPEHYRWGVVALHWVTLMLIITAFALAWVLDEMALSPLKLRLYAWHKWVGLLVLFLLPLRLFLRVLDPLKAYHGLTLREQHLALLVHGGLYVLMAAVPLAGWAHSSAAGFPVVLFGLWPLPDWVDKQAMLATQWKNLHEWGVTLLAVLVGVHALAALYHDRIRCDAVMARMAPWGRRR